MNYKLLILAFLTLSNVSLGYTQVTIGSTEKPVDGALLQLNFNTPIFSRSFFRGKNTTITFIGGEFIQI